MLGACSAPLGGAGSEPSVGGVGGVGAEPSAGGAGGPAGPPPGPAAPGAGGSGAEAMTLAASDVPSVSTVPSAWIRSPTATGSDTPSP